MDTLCIVRMDPVWRHAAPGGVDGWQRVDRNDEATAARVLPSPAQRVGRVGPADAHTQQGAALGRGTDTRALTRPAPRRTPAETDADVVFGSPALVLLLAAAQVAGGVAQRLVQVTDAIVSSLRLARKTVHGVRVDVAAQAVVIVQCGATVPVVQDVLNRVGKVDSMRALVFRRRTLEESEW
jgi:hypothetical protein